MASSAVLLTPNNYENRQTTSSKTTKEFDEHVYPG